ncbi:MAG: FG-GAP repeat domain-containing protein [Planctomycetota bacterium]
MLPSSIRALLTSAACISALAAQNEQFRPSSSLQAIRVPSFGLTVTGNVVAAAGDIDGDGDSDLIYGIQNGTTFGSSVRMLRNGQLQMGVNGPFSPALGRFTVLPTPSIALADRVFDLKVVDIDGDQDQDIIAVTQNVAGVGGQVVLLRQTSIAQATPVFQQVVIWSSPNTVPLTAEIADIDSDGALDVVAGTQPANTQSGTSGPIILRQSFSAQGSFFAPQQLTPAYTNESCRSLAIGDIDNDGDLDIFCGNDSYLPGGPVQNTVYRNDGPSPTAPSATIFTASQSLAPVNQLETRDVLLAEFQGDARPELVVINAAGGRTIYAPNVIGQGFAVQQSLPGPMIGEAEASVVAGDIDSDGDLDLVFGSSVRDTAIAVNVGGTFTLNTSRIAPDGASYNTILADIDRDGDLDIVQGEEGFPQGHNPVRVSVNLHRQFDGPTVVQQGSTVTFNRFDRPGYGNGHAAALHLSASVLEAPVTVPGFGDWGLGPVIINAPVNDPFNLGGSYPLTLTLPAAPGLAGTTWFWQWIHVPNFSVSPPGVTSVVPMNWL